MLRLEGSDISKVVEITSLSLDKSLYFQNTSIDKERSVMTDVFQEIKKLRQPIEWTALIIKYITAEEITATDKLFVENFSKL